MFPRPLGVLFRLVSQPSKFTLFLTAGLLLIAQPCHATLPGFEGTGNMAQPRTLHTATLLPDGRVLVAGGLVLASFPNSFALASAEIYDPATHSWTPTGNLANPRHQHTATLLADGRVLVVGGWQYLGPEITSAEIYDPATGTWSPTGSLNHRRRAHTATLLPDGRVLVAGGFQDGTSGSGYHALTNSELYDPSTGTWTVTGDMATARGDHTATLLANGKVLVVGGRPSFSGASSAPIATAELYDPATGTWTSTGSLNTGRSQHTATLLANGTVLAAAGNGDGLVLRTAEIYDPAAGTWKPTGSLAARHANHTATLLPNNKVLVAGGATGEYPYALLASAELYDPATGGWSITGGLVTKRDQHTATLLTDGTVLIAGGVDGDFTGNANNVLASAELYVNSIPTLLNISTRLNVQTGSKVLIGGFIITGTERKTVIVRGIGPSLAMPGALADPVIEVHGPSGELLGTNDNWKDAATRQQISDSGLAPSDDSESALWGVINPGAYTVILSGKDGGTGLGSVEVYDLDQAADSRLANLSTRGFVDTGDNVMIAGLIVGGGSPFGTANVVVRALGPSLPVTGALENPTLELYNQNGTAIAFNDDWKTRPDGTSQQAEVEATTLQPRRLVESALVRRLAAGNYTAIVRGKNNTTGIGSVEVYHLP